MDAFHYRCLLALAYERDFTRAALVCSVSVQELLDGLQLVEDTFGQTLFTCVEGGGFGGFTQQGQQVVALARRFMAEYDSLRQDVGALRDRAAVAPLLGRRSVSPRRLGTPGPDARQLDLMLLRGPDHGRLHPWRVIEFPPARRLPLADAFEAEKRRRDPLAPEDDIRRARHHAIRPPLLLAFVVAPDTRSSVPVREQWLAAGAALGNLLNAAQQLGFGAIVLSGERCFDAELLATLGITGDEQLAGFISMGSVAEAPPAASEVPTGTVWSAWAPPMENGTTPEASLPSPPPAARP